MLDKNISFVVLPSSDEYATFHFEAAWVRFSNLLNSPMMNLKVGKFELDNVVSDKRQLTLSQNGGVYQMYHFLPLLDMKAFNATPLAAGETGASTTTFGLGDNQLGLEMMGHTHDDAWRYSGSVLTSSDGSVNLPTSKAYDGFFAASRAININALGMQRFGAFSYIGQSPTQYLTQSPPGGGASTDHLGDQGSGTRNLHAYRRLRAAVSQEAWMLCRCSRTQLRAPILRWAFHRAMRCPQACRIRHGMAAWLRCSTP